MSPEPTSRERRRLRLSTLLEPAVVVGMARVVEAVEADGGDEEAGEEDEADGVETGLETGTRNDLTRLLGTRRRRVRQVGPE